MSKNSHRPHRTHLGTRGNNEPKIKLLAKKFGTPNIVSKIYCPHCKGTGQIEKVIGNKIVHALCPHCEIIPK